MRPSTCSATTCAACHLLGLCGPTVSAPFEQLSEEQTESVRQTLINLDLLST